MTKKILVIEDEKQIQELAKVFLEMQGYTVSIAASPAEGVKQAAGMDIVLIDIMMPGMNGYEVLEAIKKLPTYDKTKLKCVAFTAKSSGADIAELTKRGFDAYIIKPFTFIEFKEQIAKLVH